MTFLSVMLILIAIVVAFLIWVSGFFIAGEIMEDSDSMFIELIGIIFIPVWFLTPLALIITANIYGWWS